MKKYIIALGGLGTIVTPLVSVISCNKPKEPSKVVVKKIDLATDKISSYLKTNKNVLLDALKTAREESNNTKELKENLVANISSGNISDGLMSSFDKELAKFATSEVRKNIVENNLTLIAPKGSLKRKGTYGITWVKGTKTIIASQELEGVNANVGFFGKLDTAMNFGGTINFAITSFSKLEDNVKIIPNLIGMGTFKGQQGEALESLKGLDFTAKDFKDIISSVKMIVHNIDEDLPAIMASNHKLSSLLKLAKTSNVILNKEKFYEGVSTLINKFADLVLRNKAQIGNVIKAINLFKPDLISEAKSKLIIGLLTGNIAKNILISLSKITKDQYHNIGVEIMKFIKENKNLNLNSLSSLITIGNINIISNIISYLDIDFSNIKLQDVKILLEKLGANQKPGLIKSLIKKVDLKGIIDWVSYKTTLDKTDKVITKGGKRSKKEVTDYLQNISLNELLKVIAKGGKLEKLIVSTFPMKGHTMPLFLNTIRGMLKVMLAKKFGLKEAYNIPLLNADNIILIIKKLQTTFSKVPKFGAMIPKNIQDSLNKIGKYFKGMSKKDKQEFNDTCKKLISTMVNMFYK